MNFKKLIFLATLASSAVVSGNAWSSSGGGIPLSQIEVATDDASKQRGAMIFYNECRMCHSMKFIKYRNLLEIGFDQQFVDNLRHDKLMSEKLSATNSETVLKTMFGMVPPDLSLMAKARKQGPDYIYTLMTNYHENEDGSYDNKLFPNIKMPDIFNISTAMSDEEKVEISDKVKDVVAFLNWTADPRAAERHSLGIWVIGYFVLFSLLYYMLMKKVWRNPKPVPEKSH